MVKIKDKPEWDQLDEQQQEQFYEAFNLRLNTEGSMMSEDSINQQNTDSDNDPENKDTFKLN